MRFKGRIIRGAGGAGNPANPHFEYLLKVRTEDFRYRPQPGTLNVEPLEPVEGLRPRLEREEHKPSCDAEHPKRGRLLLWRAIIRGPGIGADGLDCWLLHHERHFHRHFELMSRERFRTYFGEEQGTEVEVEIRNLDGTGPLGQLDVGQVMPREEFGSGGDTSGNTVDFDAIQAFINNMLGFTSNLVSLDTSGSQPRKARSGLVIQRDNRYFMITAAHDLAGGTWSVETAVTFDNEREVLLIPLGGIRQPDLAVDAAICELDLDALRKQAMQDPRLKGKNFGIQYYRGPLDSTPKLGEAYGFASWNQTVFVKPVSLLDRKATYEVCMAYNGIDPATGLYEFKLARKHKGHAFYEGASGAPIAEPDGKIVSIVLEGREDRNVILGLPLSSFLVHLPG